MYFPLSWRWLRWCTLRIPLGVALQFSVPRGGASFVRLASSTRDCIRSPRLEPGSLLPRLGFHSTSEGYSVGNLVHGACSPPMLPCTTGALAALFALLGVCWKQPWPPFASVWPNVSDACSNPSLLLGNRPTLSANPRLRPPGCTLHNTHGAFVPRLRCPSRWLAACPVRALSWPVRPLLAWRVSHHWADFFGPLSCATRLCFFGLCELPISVRAVGT
ncbi:hypothetical protein V6N12_050569 [Hibiscus sabdariffa]|uniref:Secreted protein n=1 Tax=Hibiscus sabdariffa TaxID=183260 RepID=A0ABR2GCR9_9ROSI